MKIMNDESMSCRGKRSVEASQILTLTFMLTKLRLLEIPPPCGRRNDKSLSCRGNPDSYRESEASQF